MMFWFQRKKEYFPNHSIAAVTTGQLIPLSEVKDQVFSQRMMGDGIAIIPDGDYIVAPCDGVIKMMYPTLHAFGIENNDGLEILVHIGIDTINLKGQGFKKYVKEGQRVSLGDKVISVNNYQLKNNGIDLTTMMLFPNNKFPLKFVCKGKVKKAKTIVAMYEVKEKRG